MKNLLLILLLTLSSCYTTSNWDYVYYSDIRLTSTATVIGNGYRHHYFAQPPLFRYRYHRFWSWYDRPEFGWYGWGNGSTFWYWSNRPYWNPYWGWDNYWTPYYPYSQNFWRINRWGWQTPVVITHQTENKPRQTVNQPRRWNTNNYQPRPSRTYNRPQTKIQTNNRTIRRYPVQPKKIQSPTRTIKQITPTPIRVPVKSKTPIKARTGGKRTGNN